MCSRAHHNSRFLSKEGIRASYFIFRTKPAAGSREVKQSPHRQVEGMSLGHRGTCSVPTPPTTLRNSVSDKSLSLRLIATELVLACMNCFNPPDLETVQRAEDIEGVIRTTATDASAEVRKCSRNVFEAYKILLPGRLDKCVI